MDSIPSVNYNSTTLSLYLTTMTDRTPSRLNVIGIPSEAGTHFAGQSKAPEALISTGQLLLKLEREGYSVLHDADIFKSTSLDIINATKWQPAPKVHGARNEENTLQVLKYIRSTLLDRASSIVPFESMLNIFVGGDCTIAPAIYSALCDMSALKIGIIYFDGDCDLTLPHQTDSEGSTAILDSMVMSHYTHREGCLESMKTFSRPGGAPLVEPSNIVLLGQDPNQPSIEHWTYICENRFKCLFRPTVAANPERAAREAISYLKEQGCEAIFIHFDVDVIDCAEFPLANYPHYAGLKFDEACVVLNTLLAEIDRLAGIVVTEVNPNNDPTGEMVNRLTDALAGAFAKKQMRQQLTPSEHS